MLLVSSINFVSRVWIHMLHFPCFGNLSVPDNVSFFCRLVLCDGLNTINMLRRRHYVINSGFNFPMCPNSREETIEHMPFFCPFDQLSGPFYY
jgi:hypothetical protein